MILSKISRPADPYSPLWHEYNKQNPRLHRSVGADGDNDDPPSAEDLQNQLKEMQTTISNLTAQNETLQTDNQKWKDKQAEADKHRKAEAKKAQDALEEAARKSGDVEALENSWGEKYKNRETELLDQLETSNRRNYKLTVNSVATSMANEISKKGKAALISKFMKERITVDFPDGSDDPVYKVLDSNGKPSAATLDDLKKEFIENPMFEDIIIGSNASGGGPAGGAGGDAGSNTMKRSDFDQLSLSDQSKFMGTKGARLID